MPRVSRRSFLKKGSALGVGVVAAGATSRVFAISEDKPGSKILGANDRVRLAIIGIRSRGGEHLGQFAPMKDVEIAYLVDTDKRTWKMRQEQTKKLSGATPKCVQDLRKALEDPSLHAVTVATCNHWHTLATIWACQAGKDVYVEKPCSHNVVEGRRCFEAAVRYNRIVQHGTQGRAENKYARTIAVVRSGKLGKLLGVKGYCCKPRWTIGYKPNTTPPADFDFNLWLGPAPEQPYHENIVHYNWHWFWDFGNGDMGNQGVHQMDVARRGLNAGMPKSVVSLGGRWVDGPENRDQGETPNMLLSVFDYDGVPFVFETRGLVREKDPKFGFKVGVEFFLEGGRIYEDQFFPKGSDKAAPMPKVDYVKPKASIFRNFVDCVKSRKREDQAAPILEGHYSSSLCHLGNISYRLGHEATGKEPLRAFGDNEYTAASVEAVCVNLKEKLGLDLASLKYRVGAKLEFDAAKEKFVDNPKADALLTREYRKGFVVPEKV